ncbi:hypothetical protein LPUS_05544 [Lasallia pustulata]|uniref:Uncharacterized protein n=1 Tax=Lasallia pustulata TaxID=136370 RepID=A0A1W5CYZ1_9LECA|nr:hypothetical protein LPUS_05544 [Lasallia pustulata]
MASGDERDKRVRTRRIILTGFDNWGRWSSNTKASMQEKGVWDLTGNGAGVPQTQATLEKAKGTALRIILESIGNNLFRTIEGIEEITEIWDKLKTTCSQVGQGVVYAILNELFGYAAANKSKGYTKSVNAIFGDVGSLIKRLKSAVQEDRDIWDDIHIVIALGAFAPEYNNNKAHITTSKEIQVQEVQQYMASEEVPINSDRQVGVEPELAMGMQNRGRPMAHNSSYKGRRGRGDDRMCYNYGKPGHVMRNSRQSNGRPDSKRQHDDNRRPFVQNKHLKHPLNKVANVSTDDNDESEEEGKKLPLRMAKQKLPAEDNCWYVDTCAAQHITNRLDLFEPASFYDEEHEFEAANSEALYCTKKGTIAIPTGPGSNVRI